jgi:hypothetical protein
MHPHLFNLCCCLIGQHSWIWVYDRPWRNRFRKRVYRICFDCGCPEVANETVS